MNSTAWRASPLWRRLCATAHAVGPEDLAAAAHVMASAFSDDPSIRYLLGGQSMGCEDWKYFDCILKSVHGKCAMLSTSGRIHDLLVLLRRLCTPSPRAPFSPTAALDCAAISDGALSGAPCDMKRTAGP